MKSVTQHISVEMNFPVDPANAYAMLTNHDYAVLRAEKTHGSDIIVEVTGDPAVVVSKRTLPVPDELPSFAKGLVGDGIKVEETHTWSAAGADGSRTATLTVVFPTMPVKVEGTMTLSATANGCQVSIEADATSSMPMVGSVVEQGVKATVVRSARKEEEVGTEWLATH